MKKVLTLILFLLGCLGARAQVFILNDNVFQGRMSEIKSTVLDSLTNKPVAFASVYVIPSKDTTITNFTLTDAKGQAKLDEVPYGSYVFHVEMMGYKPFVKERYFRDERVDMGTIRLQVDEQFLQAATVTDVGNPIVVKQDTVEFNASSFRVGANAMLKDLLQRMPGMEITEEGKVKFNGEEIDKLTIGGRTFFFDDQSTALNSLPAAVVDKIRVIDKDSDATRATGLQDGGRQKELDVVLKKEYEKGWFGNAGLKGGSTIGTKKDDNPLNDNRGLLWNANALVSAYGEKDQLTVVADAQNFTDSDLVFVMMDDDGEISSLSQGLTTAAQLGVNANTTRIKDVESTVSVNYKYSDVDSGTRADRTTYQEDGDLESSTENSGKQYANSLSANLEFEKENGKVWFHVWPGISFGKTDSYSDGASRTLREGTLVNRSESTSHNLSTSKSSDLHADITFRELGGRKGRTFSLTADADYDSSAGVKEELSSLTMGSEVEIRNMRYDSDGSTLRAGGGIGYTEPFGEKWTLGAEAEMWWTRRNNVRDAFDDAGRNDYYSSVSRNDVLQQEYNLTLQYKFGEKSWVTFGGTVNGVLNETFSKSYGMEQMTGEDDWNWYVAPTVRFRHQPGNDRLSFSASGYSRMPGHSNMLPVLNIADPSRLSLGNVYLKPYSQTYCSISWDRNDKERFSTIMVYLYGHMNTTPIGYARWYDADGILYSIPVNARKPSFSTSAYLDYTTPLDKKKSWFLSFGFAANFNSSVSYQARTTLPGLDKDTFDYEEFMAGFWGDDASGSRFYGGESGFGESRTSSVDPTANISLKYNQDRFSFAVRAGATGHVARYSLDSDADLNTLDTRLGFRGSYVTKHEIEFESDLSYVFYKGYAEGYGKPEWQWNAEITKSIGAFNLSLTAHDILNQTRNLTHTVTANYEEDSYRLVMGRYILFGVKWNFGKMNAAHSRRAQNAAWNLVF